MRTRLWAAGAAAWTVVFIVLAYIEFHPQPWYVALVAVAGLLALSAAVLGTLRGRIALLVAAPLFVIAALLAGWRAGPVLLPAIVATFLAAKAAPVAVRE